MRKLDRRRRANFEFVREGQFQKEAEIARIRVGLSPSTQCLALSVMLTFLQHMSLPAMVMCSATCPELVLANCFMTELIKQCTGKFSCVVFESHTCFHICSVNV